MPCRFQFINPWSSPVKVGLMTSSLQRVLGQNQGSCWAQSDLEYDSYPALSREGLCTRLFSWYKMVGTLFNDLQFPSLSFSLPLSLLQNSPWLRLIGHLMTPTRGLPFTRSWSCQPWLLILLVHMSSPALVLMMVCCFSLAVFHVSYSN